LLRALWLEMQLQTPLCELSMLGPQSMHQVLSQLSSTVQKYVSYGKPVQTDVSNDNR
jgi:hypothetical protein